MFGSPTRATTFWENMKILRKKNGAPIDKHQLLLSQIFIRPVCVAKGELKFPPYIDDISVISFVLVSISNVPYGSLIYHASLDLCYGIGDGFLVGFLVDEHVATLIASVNFGLDDGNINICWGIETKKKTIINCLERMGNCKLPSKFTWNWFQMHEITESRSRTFTHFVLATTGFTEIGNRRQFSVNWTTTEPSIV